MHHKAYKNLSVWANYLFMNCQPIKVPGGFSSNFKAFTSELQENQEEKSFGTTRVVTEPICLYFQPYNSYNIKLTK